MTYTLKLLFATTMILLCLYYFWLASKWINYKLAYESGVEATVRELVKTECLRQPRP